MKWAALRAQVAEVPVLEKPNQGCRETQAGLVCGQHGAVKRTKASSALSSA
eukprot:CAMPEP_0181483330 /NCGR_PEP_ID=MMETSP1110-20121109/45364_1 /TAXON_ID=174948 /ORGANISM="Symbiodinium sp., Strain CCMP421" /LENGTH=50 /DNA_ID=CAMNT_0023609035 /DNA_START=292 /DNA_END=440 /DNA_ORIENTATION=-